MRLVCGLPLVRGRDGSEFGRHSSEGAHGHSAYGDVPDGPMNDDHAVFHDLLDHRESIQREVTRLPDGVVTITESDDPAIAEKIREHAEAMRRRLVEKRPIHMRDPLFAATFAHAEKIHMTIEPTPRGVRVVETSTDPKVVTLIQMHADVVSAFLKYGQEEVRKNHPVPRP